MNEVNHMECVRFIAAIKDGIHSVATISREINFAEQGGNKLPQSKCEFRNSQYEYDNENKY